MPVVWQLLLPELLGLQDVINQGWYQFEICYVENVSGEMVLFLKPLSTGRLWVTDDLLLSSSINILSCILVYRGYRVWS